MFTKNSVNSSPEPGKEYPMTIQKPMLADNKAWNPELVESNLPLLGSIKLDGIRMLVHNGIGYSRSLKPLPNISLQAKVAQYAEQLEGFDGEVIVGNFTDEFCFKNSHRSCMKADLEAEHRFVCFDMWNMPDSEYDDRHAELSKRQGLAHVPFVQVLGYQIIYTMYQLNQFAEEALEYGHEGTIFRRADALYKNGRATTKSGGLYKNKSRVDTEVTITSFNEQMENLNPKTTNEVGRSQRSSHKENKVGKGTLGSFNCTGFFEDGRPFETKVGVFSGFTDEDKQNIWDNQEKFLSQPMKIKYMGVGSDQSPRTPVALGFRNKMDM
jgi:DNA ligase-1